MAKGVLQFILRFFLSLLNEKDQKTSRSTSTKNIKLEKGQTQTIHIPDINKQQNFVVSKWYYKIGDIIKGGDVLCEIQNDNIAMEFESFFEGKITWCCEENQKLSIGAEICKIQGFED